MFVQLAFDYLMKKLYVKWYPEYIMWIFRKQMEFLVSDLFIQISNKICDLIPKHISVNNFAN